MTDASKDERPDLTGQLWRCRRCQHVWRGRLPTRPVRCPACRRPDWGKQTVKARPRAREEATT